MELEYMRALDLIIRYKSSGKINPERLTAGTRIKVLHKSSKPTGTN